MKNTMNNQNTDRNTNIAFASNASASVLGLVGMVAATENLVVRNQELLPLGLLKAVTKSETPNKTNPVKSYNNSKLNTGHQGICKLSEAEVTATRSAGSDLN